MNEMVERGFAEEVTASELQCPQRKIVFFYILVCVTSTKTNFELLTTVPSSLEIYLSTMFCFRVQTSPTIYWVYFKIKEDQVAVPIDIAKMFYMNRILSFDSIFVEISMVSQ